MASFGTDFGQRIDLTVRIREILRNYPEGTSILKELVQNADDAGASEVAVVLDERSHPGASCASPEMVALQGPSLLCFNDAEFGADDFASIQRLGDSLKKEKSTKTGRFGIGFNSVYHITEVASFATGSKVVWFDPSAAFVPGVDPRNPGKIVDVVRDRSLVEACGDQFRGFDGVFGWSRARGVPGTLFRLPLRTASQARTSKLSSKAHTVASLAPLLGDFGDQAAAMLLFLKSVTRLRVLRWASGADAPTAVRDREGKGQGPCPST